LRLNKFTNVISNFQYLAFKAWRLSVRSSHVTGLRGIIKLVVVVDGNTYINF